MGMDVLAAAGAAIALEQVPNAVQGRTPPGTEDRLVQAGPVADEQLQQGAQIGRVPVAGHIAFSEADIARAQAG
jgi:hypothetical protein